MSPKTRAGLLARTSAVVGAAAAMGLLAAGPALAQEPGAPPSAGPSAGASPQQANPSEKSAAEVRPAIVYLTETYTAYVADETGTYFNGGSAYQLTMSCTGFGVSPQGYIATAGHCVDTTSPDGIRASFIQAAAQSVVDVDRTYNLQALIDFGTTNWIVEGTAKGSPIEGQISAVIGSGTGSGAAGQSVPARIVDFRPQSQGDVALLKVESSDLPSTVLATDSEVQVGTQVLSMGYPASADAVTDPTLEPSTKDGQVSTKRMMNGVPFYETSASLTPGMSGGPTVDLEGDVVGINSAYLRNDQAFNFIAPSTALNELLSRNGVKAELGPNDTLYREALTNYYGGRYSDAIAGFDRLLLVDPDHNQAKEYKTLAAKAKERFGDAPAPAVPGQGANDSDDILGMTPWLFWSVVGGGSAVIVGGIALALVLARRRKGGAAAGAPQPPMPRDGRAAGAYADWAPGAQGPVQQNWNQPQFPQYPQAAGVLPSERWGQGRPAAPIPGADGPTAIVTPANIMASQRPAPKDVVQSTGSNAIPAPVNGSSADTSSAATTIVSLPTSTGCPNCGTTLADGAAFCSTCGTKQS
ncbi:MAG: trypsin-like peptidase domain-containing protein [Pseudonocardia sp.]|nr:trypsin-like peptidase domain-containing protein [Pseudonocardia sp.]